MLPAASDNSLRSAGAQADVALALLGAWNAHDLRRAAGLYATDYVGEDVGQARLQHGPRARTAVLAHLLRAFPDMHWSGECIAQGDTVALIWTMGGTHRGTFMHIPPTGKVIHVQGVSILTIRDGKVSHGRHIWDTAGLLRTLGLLPELP